MQQMNTQQTQKVGPSPDLLGDAAVNEMSTRTMDPAEATRIQERRSRSVNGSDQTEYGESTGRIQQTAGERDQHRSLVGNRPVKETRTATIYALPPFRG